MNLVAQVFLYLIGFSLFLAGIVALFAIKSDIQVILAVLAFGLGGIVFAAAWALEDLRIIRQRLLNIENQRH